MKRRDEVIVGVFITFAVLVGIVGTLWLARRGFTKSYPMYARFDWGSNLKVGQPVLLAGVQVGYVDNVQLNQTGYLNVTLAIDRQWKIPEGTSAVVQNEGFFGDKSVALHPCRVPEPGFGTDVGTGPSATSPSATSPSATSPSATSPSATARPAAGAAPQGGAMATAATAATAAADQTPLCRPGAFLPAGDTIPTGKGAPSIDQIMTRVDSMSGSLADVVQAVRIQMVQQGGLADLRKTIASTNELAQQLTRVAAEQSHALALTEAAARRTLNALDSVSIDSTVRNMRTTTHNLTVLTATLDTTTQRLDQVVAKIDRGDGTVGKLLNDPSVYNDIHRLLAQLDSLTADIKANPKKYINVKVF